MIPFGADRVIQLDPHDGRMVGCDAWPIGFTKGPFALRGGVYDGRSIWMIPFSADCVVKIPQVQ